MSLIARLWTSGRSNIKCDDRVNECPDARYHHHHHHHHHQRQQLRRQQQQQQQQQHQRQLGQEVALAAGPCDKNTLHFGADRVRILLFRECEWRGRKLLFDSYALERSGKRRDVEEASSNAVARSRNNAQVEDGRASSPLKTSSELVEGVACEHGKLLCEDISLLCEMIFGTVAMTYRGPSFKIHAISTPGCIMCTKVFPYSEHSACRQSDRHSSETLGSSSNLDSNSSSSSLRTQNSRPDSNNSSNNSLNPTLRKSSTCSSTGSGWDIDVPRLASSQSLEGSSVSGGGSLSSLRHRWQRVVSTSLTRSESNDAFGHNCEGTTNDGVEVHARKHKTRLGLALLLQLPPGRERETNDKLLEHAAILEGMLDRLRYSCVEGRGPERNLVTRLYRASSFCTLRLLKLLINPEPQSPAPLLWHDLLLNSTLPVEIQVDTVTRSLQQMCGLLEEFDTKSTNFFLSTIVTAVLTHHLGWVHTAPPHRNKQLTETLGHQYPCNPLWAQLSDLYGSVGTPARMAHTVIAGEPEKAQLIESILNFLSYFLRSGLVDKHQEARCPDQEDVQEAIAILERAVRKNPSLEQEPSSSFTSSSCAKRSLVKSHRRTKLEVSGSESESPYALAKSKSYEEPRKSPKHEKTNDDGFAKKVDGLEKSIEKAIDRLEEGKPKKLKRNSTLQKNLNDFGMTKLMAEVSERNEIDHRANGKVKIIVSDENKRKVIKDGALIRSLEKKNVELTAFAMESKLEMLRQQKLAGFDEVDLTMKALDNSLVLPSNLGEEIAQPTKSQVFFTLGGEETPATNLSIHDRLKSACKCQCSYTFTRVPSTSAELPEGVLRKIIQRNFPESSKNMQPPVDCESDFGICLKCHRGYASGSQRFENGKLLLETPTNATEVLRGCASSSSADTRVFRSNSLEALIEANCVIELPMPRSKKVSPLLKKMSSERVGFSKSLVGAKTARTGESSSSGAGSGYTWGMVVQGITKRKKKGRRRESEPSTRDPESLDDELKRDKEEWWWPIREGLDVDAKFPLVDQPVSEALCILGDLDNWQVGVLSNAVGRSAVPTPIGMSRLVSNMLEAFACMWKEFRSPRQCIKLLESRLREMWLRSESLAEFLLAADLSDASVDNLTNFLDVDAADLPLLLAVATTHSPQIAQRFGLTMA